MSVRVDGSQGGGGRITQFPNGLKSKHDSSMSDDNSGMTYLFVILGLQIFRGKLMTKEKPCECCGEAPIVMLGGVWMGDSRGSHFLLRNRSKTF